MPFRLHWSDVLTIEQTFATVPKNSLVRAGDPVSCAVSESGSPQSSAVCGDVTGVCKEYMQHVVPVLTVLAAGFVIQVSRVNPDAMSCSEMAAVQPRSIGRSVAQ